MDCPLVAELKRGLRVMADEKNQQYNYVGMRLNKNLYCYSGALVVPAFTVLTSTVIEMLLQQKIILRDEDVENVSILHLVDSAIMEVKDIFHSARYADQLSFAAVREKIIPVVLFMSRHPDFNHILTHLKQHEEYIYRHSIGVALLSKIIGETRGYQGSQLIDLITSGFLHDIGKSKIPSEILNKPGKLTREEFELVKNHTIYGYELIKQSSEFSEQYAYVALQHHEREDGSGYPFGLKGNEISQSSKVVAVADVFHAMISKRVYKNSIPFYQVLQEMSQYAYGALEPGITLSFMKRIMDLLIGNSVLLSNGHEGKIIMVSTHDPVNPLIEVNGTYIDLSKDKTITLERIL
jgi:HD-GYP domain-containing protein (c-di-GMP phosphodiesterase class II)